jgi:hypothetical protein
MDTSLMQSEELIPPPATIDDTHKVYSIAIACVVLGSVTTLTCATRLMHRFRERALGPDDYAVVPALVCLTPHQMNRKKERKKR